jgi:5-methylcytosine-specific restriction protein A
VPNKPLKPCKYPGCPELVASGYCAKHGTENKKNLQSKKPVERDKDRQRLYDRNWQKIRNFHFRKYPWCEKCMDYKKYVSATDVHHVIPHKGNREIFYKSPLQSLCHECHSKQTRLENWKDYQINYPLIKQTPTIPIIMICGAPASGKSTYIVQHAENKDIVIDLDLIKAKVSGKPIYFPVDKRYLDLAIRKRNEILENLYQFDNDGQKVWFIVAAGRYSDRELWRRILSPIQTLVMLPSKAECINRIEADQSRRLIKHEQIAAVHTWFDFYYQIPGEIEVREGGFETSGGGA